LRGALLLVLAVVAAVVAALIALLWTAVALRLLAHQRGFPCLADIDPETPPGGWPKVSVIVPSRNEQRTVEAATRALLALDYPALEVVAIDDRSTDATGSLLDTLAAVDPRLRVRHVTDLPAGWLGKNHAMAEGAAAAQGEWLLFTDGDVLFAPDALRRAMAFGLRHRLGHVVAMPHLIAPGFFERLFVTTFGLLLTLKFRPWALSQPRTRAFAGVGAFNLVKREAYEAIGGHARLAFEVVDDAKLGLILRRSGVPQGACDSGGLVRVRWQEGFLASVRGLEKNAFAAVEWSVPRSMPAIVVLALLSVGPLLAGLHPSGLVRIFGVVGLVVPMIVQGVLARRVARGSGLEGLGFPLGGLLVAAVFAHSAYLAIRRGGIYWRGTFYPLDALRKGCVRERDFPASRAVGWPAA
jgi:Glycosyl transferase family 2